MIALATVASACSTPTRAPAHGIATRWGVVRSDDEELARRTAEAWDACAPTVVSMLLDEPPPHVDIWILSEDVPGVPSARTWTDRIELGSECAGQEDWLVAHEFAHWCMMSDPLERWTALPYVAKEGLAEAAAFRAVPRLAAAAGASHREALTAVERIEYDDDLLEVDVEGLAGIEDESIARALYAFGFTLALRLKPSGLANACATVAPGPAGTIPMRALIVRAGLDGAQPARWIEVLEEDLASRNR